MNKEIVIVGGGIVGLFSAIYLKERFEKVTLIEKNTNLGGLLKSTENQNGIQFDYGTHIPMETNNPEVNRILYQSIEKKDWEIFETLKPGSYFEGILNTDSVYPRADYLPDELYYKGLSELLNSMQITSLDDNLELYLKEIYGDTYAKYLYGPIIRKFLGEELENLSVAAFKLFDLNRIIVGDEFLSKELKKSEVYDSKIGYNKYSTRSSVNKKYYPKNNNGIQKWIDQLYSVAVKNGVNILIENEIKCINTMDNKVTVVETLEGEKYKTDYLIWTAPVQLMKKVMAGNANDKSTYRPKFRNTILYHMEFNEDFKVDNHYIMCLDKKLKTFRVTLYPNLSNTLKTKGIYNCTVEVFIGSEEKLINEDIIMNELIEMGVIDQNYQLKSITSEVVYNSFPVIDAKFIKANEKQKTELESQFKNILFLGKASGNAFFMNESIVYAYEELKELS